MSLLSMNRRTLAIAAILACGWAASVRAGTFGISVSSGGGAGSAGCSTNGSIQHRIGRHLNSGSGSGGGQCEWAIGEPTESSAYGCFNSTSTTYNEDDSSTYGATSGNLLVSISATVDLSSSNNTFGFFSSGTRPPPSPTARARSARTAGPPTI